MGIAYTLYTNTTLLPHMKRTLTQIKTGTIPDSVIAKMNITDPVFTIKNSAFSEISKANYVTLGAPFNRSYFLGAAEAGEDGLTRIPAHVDVLGTFKAALLNCNVLADRSSSWWNMYLADNEFKVYNYKNISTHEFEHGFEDYSMVLTVLGG